MRTRSNSYPNNSNTTIPRRQNRRRVPNIVEPEIRTTEEVVPMADRTIEELLQAPTEGYGEAIVILKILAENFEIKTNLLQLVQTNKFHGFERDNPHTHISNFKRMTSTLKYRDVPNDTIKLMLFSYSLEGAARIWYEKEPPNSILTWDDFVNKFVNQFFPPSKTTHLKNEISRFIQRFEETFGEAWERFKEMHRACPHRGFSEKSSSKTDDRIDKLADQISNIVEIVNKYVITPATVKMVEKYCVICGGAHAYYDCIATDCNESSVCAATGTYNQLSSPNRASNQMYSQSSKRIMGTHTNVMQGTSLTKQERECKLYDAFDKFAYQKGETLRDFYLRFSLLLNDMNMYNMKLEQFQVNTKFLNTLPSEWSKFVTDVKLVRDLHTTNVDQLHAYLGQHECHANEVRLMHERTFDPLALISQHQLSRTLYPHHQPMYQQSQFQPQATSYQLSPYGPTYHNSQVVSSGPSSLTHSISYPGTDTSSLVNHNAYLVSSFAPQITYTQMDQQSSEYSPPEAGLVVPVFQKGNDPIDAINHMMSFLTSVVASRFPATN
nr:reverse transcriptase domain-containing protein [Tanacetum cinerariifolium]